MFLPLTQTLQKTFPYTENLIVKSLNYNDPLGPVLNISFTFQLDNQTISLLKPMFLGPQW